MRKILAGALIVVAGLFLLSVSSVLAQGETGDCYGDFNCDGAVAADDVSDFLSSFGRSQYFNPCPSCQDSPCPCSSTVPKTGQTTSYATGDDGDLEKGLAWPNPRFTDNGDGTVTDNLTNLIWLKNANCFGIRTWIQAFDHCQELVDEMCGLTDGSNAGDWRLPNIRELLSLVDYSGYNPALPLGHPFLNTEIEYFWSSTTAAANTNEALYIPMDEGFVRKSDKTTHHYAWPVRGGQ